MSLSAGGARSHRTTRRDAGKILATFVALIGSLPAAAFAEDWPTYQHDIARSGVCAETIRAPLQEQWVFQPTAGPAPGWADPQPVPVEGMLELPRVKFDDAFHAVAVGDRVFFGSSGDNKLYCLDARTGRVLWVFFTGGPVRLAPMVVGNRVYFGSDDGFAYCLDASNGRVVWKARGGPTPERVLGHGRMVSMWPLRTGVLVDGDTAYFTAGIFPGERIYIRAVRAADGSPVWTNDTLSDRGAGRDGFSPQGYLLASASTLFVPAGRNLPGAFDRADGRFRYQPGGSWRALGILGGTYALLQGDQLYSGTEEQVVAADQASGKLGAAWFPGKRVVFADGLAFMIEGNGVLAFDAATYPEASQKRKGVANRRMALLLASPKPKDREEQLRKLDEEARVAQAEVDKCTKWSVKRSGLETIVAAGNTLYAGGKEAVVAFDKGAGSLLWETKVDGTVRSMAASNGRVYACTDTGAVYCFAQGNAPAGAVKGQPKPEVPFALDIALLDARRAAESILARTGIKQGYCLVLGSGSGRLAYALARSSDLRIYAVDPDPAKVAAARKALDAAGLYGSRVTVDQGSADDLPYPDYFAHLVVSEEALLRGKLSTPPEEVLRVLKPCGGTLCLYRASSRPGDEQFREWQSSSAFSGCQVTREDDGCVKVVRGRLEGSADWTHQYGSPENTASTDDRQVRCPLGVLWYGEPGPNKVPSRHAGNAAPLVVGGRAYLQGDHRILCFDAYNGYPYWEREIRGAYRVGMVSGCSNLAANDKGIFAAIGDRCLFLDAETGETTKTYSLPPTTTDVKRRWSYVALAGDALIGGVALDGQHSSALFALDVKSGKPIWTHEGTKIRDNTLAISEGRLFFADSRATGEQRQEALKAKVQELVASKGIDAAAAEKELKSADVRVVAALDLKSGAKAWERPVDLTDCGAHVLVAMATRGVLLFCGSHANGHYWPQFLGGEYAARRVTALSTRDGSPLWSKPIGYRIRPLVIGDLLVAEPWGFNLHTGEQRMRAHPVTGEPSIWEFERPGHHCGTISGSPNALYYRSWSAAYYDLNADQGTEHFSGQRPGCWINMIPAGGVVVMPEASSGCVCNISIHCTTVFKPRETHKAWGMFADRAPATPVKRLGVSFGAPGDRADDEKKLWLAFPRPGGRMGLPLAMSVNGMRGSGYFTEPAETSAIAGTKTPWAYASGYFGLAKCTVPLVKAGDGAASYTVRLGFADTMNKAPGQRVFDIKIQDRVVATDFDIIRAAGGPNRAAVREFPGVVVADDLTVEMVPKGDATERTRMPLLNVIEVERERVLHVGLQAPSFIVSDADRERAGEVAIRNHTDKEFAGTLRLTAPDGFAVSPATADVRLAPGQKMEVPVQVSVARPGAKGNFALKVALVRPDGATEAEREGQLEYLGPRRRVVVQASADTYVSNGSPAGNYGHGATILVDGGAAQMGDESHNIGYLRFPVDVPGKVVSVLFRIRTSPAEAAESGDSGRIYLVADPWDENAITYATQPKRGVEVGALGRVGRDTWEERPLKVDLAGRKEISLVLVPTSTDGASYVSREGKQGPELVIEYEP